MRINTISAYETTAEKFFGALESWDVDLLLDTRLKNTNQLAGFTKKNDLAYFVPKLLHADYVHDKLFAPAPTMLERYLHGNIGWDAYADAYRAGKHRAVADQGGHLGCSSREHRFTALLHEMIAAIRRVCQ